MKRGVMDFWVGLFAVAGAAALLFLALQVSSTSNLATSSSYELIANFQNIGGLKVKAPVKSAGVVVGRVTAIELDPDLYVARVKIAIDSHYQFSRDSTAEILTLGILGEQYIGITTGAEDKMLTAGDKFKHTSSAIVLEQLISRFLFSKAEGSGNNATTPDAGKQAP